MQKNPLVYVIILNYNGSGTLEACVSSVFQSDYTNYEVVIVDNDSHDGSFDKARIKFPKARFIKNPENLGFARGVNIGIRYALEKFADYVFLLNNDAVLEKDCLSVLVRNMEQKESCGIGSPIIYEGNKESVWFAGGLIDWLKMRTEHVFKVLGAKPYHTEYVTGCAMAIKKSVFKKIGLFDERYFLYYEDADFSLRAFRNGFDLIIVPSALVYHWEQSRENPEKIYWLVLSGLIFFNTNALYFKKIWIKCYVTLRRLKNFKDILNKRNFDAAKVRRAYADYKNAVK